MRVSAWLVVAVVALPAPAPAQAPAPSPQTPVFRTGIDLLTVDVTVTDADGRQVSDLQAGDFTVEVDGKARQVVSAEYLRTVDDAPAQVPRAEELSAAALVSTNSTVRSPGRSILLLVDQGNIRMGMGRGVMRAAADFVDTLQPADRVAVVAIPGPGVLVDFTTAHERVREGLLAITGRGQPYNGRFNISQAEARAAAEHSDALLRAALMARECAFGTPADQERCERDVEQEATQIVTLQRQQTMASLHGMREVLTSLGALDGPKSVILISEGLVLESQTSDIDQIAAIAADVRASLDVLLLDVPAVDPSVRYRPATPREDRDMQTEGLETLAGLARGSLHRVVASADRAFQRIGRSLAGYYLIGVEATAADRDGRRHEVEVRTTRRGLQVSSRRGFLAPPGPAATSPAEAIGRALASPLPFAEIPLRLATWTYQDTDSGRVRVLVAVEVERLAEQPLDYTTGLLVVDQARRAVVNDVRQRTLAPAPGDDEVAVFVASLAVEPGRYLVRFAAADSHGRLASVERRVDAWAMTPNALTIGDLIVAAPPEPGGALQPSVEARVQGRMAALVEVYAEAPATLDGLEATLEVVSDEDGAPIASAPMRHPPTARPGMLQGDVDTSALPPGRYLARATIRQGGTVRGHLLRPVRIVDAAPTAATAGRATADAAATPAGRAMSGDLEAALTAGLGTIEPQALLTPAIMTAVLAAAERDRPAATKAALAEARQGRLGAAAVTALGDGDQTLAAFLKGLELLGQDEPARAAQQFQSAMQASPTFAPARLYLGASLAQASRYREAASLLQSVPADLVEDGTPARLAGETWLKAGEPALAVAALQQAAPPARDDWRTMRLLGIAYAVDGQPEAALAALVPGMGAHATDQQALLAGLHSVYRRHATGSAPATLAADREMAIRWAASYRQTGGPLQALVERWLAFLRQVRN